MQENVVKRVLNSLVLLVLCGYTILEVDGITISKFYFGTSGKRC